MKATDQSRLRMCVKASKSGNTSTEKIVQGLNWRKFEIDAVAVVFGVVSGIAVWCIGGTLTAAVILSFLLVVSFACSFVLLQRMWDLKE